MLPELNRSNCYKYTTSTGEVVMIPSRVCKLFVKLPVVSLLTVSVVVILVIYHIERPRLGHNSARLNSYYYLHVARELLVGAE
jgi:hypothetical protein